MHTLSTQEDIRNFFESDQNTFIDVQRYPRVMGYHQSRQLVLKDIDVQAPIVFGQPLNAFDGSQPISNLIHLTSSQYLARRPHIVFQSGTFHSLIFKRFKDEFLSTTGGSVLLSPKGWLTGEATLNLEISGGTFNGPVRFRNSMIGNITIKGGTFEDVVVFERGIYGTVRIQGGDFKKGLYFGVTNLFDQENLFAAIPGTYRPWASSVNGIYSGIILEATGEFDVTIRKVLVTNEFKMDSKMVRAALDSVLCTSTATILSGRIVDLSSRYNELAVGSRDVVSKPEVFMTRVNINRLKLSGILPKDGSISFAHTSINNVEFAGFINQGSVIWDQLSFSEGITTFTQVYEDPKAQGVNEADYMEVMARNSIAGGGGVDSLKGFEVALTPTSDFSSQQAIPKFRIANSDLGKMAFLNCSINAELVFENSKISELSLLGTDFPTDRFGDDVSHSQRRTALFQLKKVYESVGDSNTARRLKMAEYEAYRHELSSERANEEKWTLELNFWSNSHGENWFKALRRLISGALLFWFLASACFFVRSQDLWQSIEIFLQSIPYFIEFLSPIHKLGFIESYAISVGGYKEGEVPRNVLAFANVVDGIWRILAAYLIFQLVSAFRRHAK